MLTRAEEEEQEEGQEWENRTGTKAEEEKAKVGDKYGETRIREGRACERKQENGKRKQGWRIAMK